MMLNARAREKLHEFVLRLGIIELEKMLSPDEDMTESRKKIMADARLKVLADELRPLLKSF